MKRAISLLTVLAMMTSFACFFSSCKKDENSADGKSLLKYASPTETETETETGPVIQTQTDPIDPTDTDPTSSSSDSLQKTSIETTSYDCPTSVIGPHEIPEYAYQEILIEDTVILDKDGLTIHVNGYQLGMGTERLLMMHLENQTGHPISLNLKSLSVDGFKVSPMWLKKFEDGASEDFDVEFFLTLGNEIGLWDPGMFQIRFEVEYTDTESVYVSDPATFYTSVYDPAKVYDLPYATVLFEDANVRISAVDFVYFRDEPRLYILYENLSAEAYTFRFEESLINGYPASLFTYVGLEPGEKYIDTLYIRESDLEEIGVDTIETISGIIMYSTADNYFDGTLCDPFTLSVS